mmetsp:Transcript_101275/g.179959  ORF Transcript_101275/g.179959 Transcript_101275/m.179959 type:complete len:253 (-) Transcript_101275:15-773(-)
MSMSTLRISVFTLFKGCKCPPVQGNPLAFSKLKGLNFVEDQVPLEIISAVMSATAFWASTENFSVFSTLNAVTLVGAIIFRFFRASSLALSKAAKFVRSAFSSSATESTMVVTALDLSIEIHLFFMAVLVPAFAEAPTAASTSALEQEPFDFTKLKTCTSGAPFCTALSPSAVSFRPSLFMDVVLIISSACTDLMAPTNLSWSQPFSFARTSESSIAPFSSRCFRRRLFISPAMSQTSAWPVQQRAARPLAP